MTLEKVDNQKRNHHKESNGYWYTEDANGTPLLFCQSEIKSAQRRALRRTDLRPQLSWWPRLFGGRR